MYGYGPRTKADLLRFVTKPIQSSRLSARSTLAINYADGSKAIRYHDTDVVTFKKNKVILNSGGFRTSTTKARMNEHLKMSNLTVFTDKGIWYVCPIGNWDQKEYFYDGITFDVTGKLLSKSKAPVLKKINNTKKAIARFVKQVDKLNNIPMPNGEEVKVSAKLLNTEVSGDLIYQALYERNYNNPYVIMEMNCKTFIKCALRRFLMKSLLPELQAK